MKNILKLGLLLGMGWILLLAGGCGQNAPQTPATQPLPQSEAAQVVGSDKQKLVLYFATKDANHVAAETVVVAKTDNPAQTAVEHLLAGPKSPELRPVAIAGVKLKRLWLKDHTAYLDFSDTLLKKAPGGSAYERLFVGAIVNTLTEFPAISNVRFLVEGKNIDTINGHLDLSEPVRRDEELIKRP